MRRLRVYADTSVFGGCFDEEFDDDSRAFFRDVVRGRFTLVVSPVLLMELRRAPERVQRVLTDLPDAAIEVMDDSVEIRELRDAYLSAGILGPAAVNDAEHIASASVALVDLVVSWNFQHIVHFDKIRQYEAVNLLRGYRPVRIHSPKEVVEV